MVSFSRLTLCRKNKMTGARAGDITVADGQGNVKLHPYLVTLVRWCVSCLWSTATVLLHRLTTAPLQPITGTKPPSSKPRVFKRAAGTEHLHPEPKVECQLLHQPNHHTLDVIFVHGLYGSLGNTWRQGDWRSKYKRAPKKVTLRDHSEKPCCHKSSLPHTQTHSHTHNENNYFNENKCDNEKRNSNDDINIDSEMTFKKINEKLFKKIIPKENDLITEKFYNNTLSDQIEIKDNYKTQANFVRDLFKTGNNCDNGCDAGVNENRCKNNEVNECKCSHSETKCINNKINEYKCSEKCKISCSCSDNHDKCKVNEVNGCKCSHSENKCINNEINESECSEKFEISCSCSDNGHTCKNNEVNACKCTERKCEMGCGCVCDQCYSTCWPRDWIQMDFPGARVISINYTSDPYLWRPLWIKENKRLSLHVRAEQMMQQLLEMGVGEKPIIWVGHSKGGLFIKQIYCEAYEEYKKLNKNFETVNPEPKNEFDVFKRTNSTNNDAVIAETIDNIVGSMFDNKEMYTEYDDMTYSDYEEQNSTCLNETKSYKNYENDGLDENKSAKGFNKELNGSFQFNELTNVNGISKDNENKCKLTDSNGNINELSRNSGEAISSTIEERSSLRAAVYAKSHGFMFYSVPHRGSPLADIKTPVTARSLELLEISKDCPLVLDLQARWLEASGARSGERGGERGGARPAVRGFVETCRTLMSVLWLRIVSVDSADAGIGTLLGVSVDHREICKPSSRHCMLYTELTNLINEALNNSK